MRPVMAQGDRLCGPMIHRASRTWCTYALSQRSYPRGHLVPQWKFVQNRTPSGSLLAFVQPAEVRERVRTQVAQASRLM
jgi:hypothetical protein